MDEFAKTVVPILIQEELRSSYMDYSMSVIIGRALPDVRDGLKPVHRRILYAMHEMGLRSDKKYSKCAGTVGEVLKKFHPHGDSAVYDALVRMAQPWNLRYLLIDGQGNFGSVDGDPAAAYRYTESRMTKLAEELLVDIDQETVEFSPNFDGTTEEPDVLPARFPNLLVNGAEGIAVGMATKIPPHNLGEIIDACVAVIDQPELDTEELLEIVPGPDFPTGGTIYGRQGVRDAYTTGRGRVVVRGTAHFEDLDNRQAIVITEIPFQVNKARLLEAIADLVKEKKIEGISALRDESDREGMRIVVELKRDTFPEVILNQLYKHTALQQTFGVILLAIVNQRPRILTLKEMLLHYIAHRREVTLRRSRFQLKKARERLHLVEGFLKAIDVIDAIIALIRASQTVEEAREGLVRTFGFTEVQAQAILDMRLQRLTGMERQKLLDEQAELLARIADLEAILASETRLMAVVRQELVEVKEAYGDVRRTRFVEDRGELSMHDLVAEEDQIVTVSHLGYIKRCRPDEWRMQRRGGVGRKGMATREEDFVTSLQVANTHDVLLVFTNKGQVFPLQVYDVPEAGRESKGRPIINLVPIPDGERVAAVVSVREVGDDETSLLFVTRRGLIKRTPLGAFKNLRAGGMRASTVEEADDLLAVRRLGDDAHVMLFSRQGKCIRFELGEVPELSRGAMGNYGMKLEDDDAVVDVVLAPLDQLPAPTADDEAEAPAADEAEAAEGTETGGPDVSGPLLLTVTENGYGARTSFTTYRLQGRYGKGIVSFGASSKTGKVVGAVVVGPDTQLMLVTDSGRVIRILASSVPTRRNRGTQGVRLMRLEEHERIVDVEPIEEAQAEAEDGVEVEAPAGEE